MRYYKDATDHDSVESVIIAGAGIHFDPELVEVFVSRPHLLQEIHQ
jgi:response regulator RpfG family c-di-GMP phosphodiesterase